MALETGNYVGDLTVTNPAAADPKSQGDDHLRLIKTALRQSFPGFAGAIICAGTNGGAANTYTLTPTTALVSYVAGMMAVFAPTADNSGASTLNISGLGAKSLKNVAGGALAAGELLTGKYYAAIYDGTNFNLVAVTKAYIDGLSFAAALPSQPGNSGKFITTDGSTASWAAITPATIGAVDEDNAVITANGLTYTGNMRGNVTALSGTSIDVSVGSFRTKSISSNTTFTLTGETSGKMSAVILELTTSSSAQPTFTGARTTNGAGLPTLSNGVHQIGIIYSGSAYSVRLMDTVMS